MVAKAGLGLIGLSAISVGGVALAKPHLLGMDYMPSYKSLSGVNDYTNTYKDKFGHKHGKYGVSNEKANESGWNGSFRRLQEDKDKVNNGAFAFNTKVNSGFKEGEPEAGATQKSLSQVCGAAYKADNGKVKADGNGTDEFNEEHVWKYCSPFGGKLKTVKDVDNPGSGTQKYGNNTMGDTKKDDLISVTDSTNDKFGEIRNKEFKEKGENSLSHNDTESYFAHHKEGKTIKQLCGEVYGLTASSAAPKVEETTVVKYCALSSSTGAS